MCSGRLFQATGPVTHNARFPSCSLVLGTTKSPRAAERRAERLGTVETGNAQFVEITCIGVNRGGWGCIPQIYGGGWLYHYPPPQYGWLTGQPSGPQHSQIAPAYSEPIGLVTVDSTSSSFTSISKISISLGFVHFAPGPQWAISVFQDTLDFASIHPPPKVTEPLTPLIAWCQAADFLAHQQVEFD